MKQRIILPRDIDVVVTSFGGAGTTFLLKFLSQYKKTNHPYDTDGYKHLPLPPISFNKNIKFVYLYADPQLAVISLFRRKYQHPQSKKLQRWCAQDISPVPEEMSLHKYASMGIDKFHFRNHFYNWYDRYLAHPTIFLRYETLFDNIEPLIEFLGIPKAYTSAFPTKKSRTSSKGDISSETLKLINRIYGDFSGELAKLNDVEIRIPTRQKRLAMTSLKNPYLKALATQPYKKMAATYVKEKNPTIYRILKNTRDLIG